MEKIMRIKFGMKTLKKKKKRYYSLLILFYELKIINHYSHATWQLVFKQFSLLTRAML